MSLSKNPFVEFLKATLAGGVLFLLPVVLVLIVLFLVSLLAGLVARTETGGASCAGQNALYWEGCRNINW
jgi:uncharacterized membrane protein